MPAGNQMGPSEQDFMKQAASGLSPSVRVFRRILKVSPTIAVMEGSREGEKVHLIEVVQYRERRGG